jgi:hypoxanthine phosphoribosyltransferase
MELKIKSRPIKNLNWAHSIISANGYKLSGFKNSIVVAIAEGGIPLGLAASEFLKTALIELNIRYPLSRLSARAPFLKPVLWPFKELIYKMTSPSWQGSLPVLKREDKILLIDDTVSSGKTVNCALEVLKKKGIKQKNITVATYRAGKKGKKMVDILLDTPEKF